MERSATPRPAVPSGAPAGAPGQPARSGFGSGLMGGIAGGLLGVGIGSLLMGNGLSGGGGMGFLGFVGLLLQIAVAFFVVRWLLRLFVNRSASSHAAAAGAGRMGMPVPMAGMPMGGGYALPTPPRPVSIGPADFEAFGQLLVDVQTAWSANDLRALAGLTTAEMAGYFREQLDAQMARGLRNSVSHVKLEQGDLAEAWAEDGREYATVAMRFSMLDVTRDSAGRIVEGDLAQRTMTTEIWTFVRPLGGRWVLSAIQQTR